MVGAPPLYLWYKDEYMMKDNVELEEIIKEYRAIKGFRRVLRAINVFDNSKDKYIAAQDTLRDRKSKLSNAL